MFIGRRGIGTGVVPEPGPNESAFSAAKGPANGPSDIQDSGSGLTKPMFTDAIVPVPSGGETAGTIIKTTVRRFDITDGQGEGNFEAQSIPGSGVKIPKPGY